MKPRFRAAGVNFAASLAIAAAVFLAAYWVWYPGALFAEAGGRELFFLIAGVQMVLGPLMVFILYVPGKRGLAFDLATVAILQAVALGAGIWVLFESRPVFLVFVKDRFELVRANEIPEAELRKATRPAAEVPLGRPRVVAAVVPGNPDEQFRIMMSAMSGVDLHYFPQHYVDYEEMKGEVMLKAHPIARLRALNPARAGEIDAVEKRLGKSDAELRFLPMRAGKRALAVILDGTRADVVEITALKPWEFD
jgi:hypothetical protein